MSLLGALACLLVLTAAAPPVEAGGLGATALPQCATPAPDPDSPPVTALAVRREAAGGGARPGGTGDAVEVDPTNTCRRSFCPVEVVIDGRRYTVWQPCTVCDPILV